MTDAQRAAWAPPRYEDSPLGGQDDYGSSPEYWEGDGVGEPEEGAAGDLGQRGYGAVSQVSTDERAGEDQYDSYAAGGAYLSPGQMVREQGTCLGLRRLLC